MKRIHFYKYHGTGNDFVMIDNREEQFPMQDKALIQRLCHRRYGVGGDGLILLQDHDQYAFEMLYFNADATTSMCGNGSRCAVDLAHRLDIVGQHCEFYAEDGPHQATIDEEGLIHIRMVDVAGMEPQAGGYFLNTGTRHYVRPVEDLSNFDVMGEGKRIRYADAFMPEGTNASFTEMIDGQAHMRIYERGVEDETLSSGTGVTAVALCLAQLHDLSSPVSVHTRGGHLQVSFRQQENGTFTDVFMIGPAVMVFEGTVFV